MTEDPWSRNADLPRGVADNLQVSVESVVLADGSRLSLPSPGVTAVVGANNVGKSTFLKELNRQIPAGDDSVLSSLIIRSAHVRREGTVADFLSWLYRHRPYESKSDQVPTFSTRIEGRSESVNALRQLWERRDPKSGLGNLAAVFSFHTDAGHRQRYITGSEKRSDAAALAAHPMHLMQDHPSLVDELSNLSELIFRQKLTLDGLSGNVNLRVGSVSVPVPRVDRITAEYKKDLLSLPKLAEQGDGMRSLFGLLIPLVCSLFPIVMVDEPEAFLHPPQALALGTSLARLAREKNIQIILATHDRSLLAGLLEGGADVSVIKLDRAGDTTSACQLNSDELRALWDDPVLRYTNALDGLFHRLVVLMEGDRDCHFFSAVLDELDAAGGSEMPSGEVLFVPCSGKAGMARIARSLKLLGVRTVASPDLDILNDASVVRDLVGSLGGDWAQVEDLHRQATSQFSGVREEVRADQVLTSIKAVLEPRGSDVFDKGLRDDVKSQMRLKDNPWEHVKKYGVDAFRGECRVKVEELLEMLTEWDVVPLREGELENLAPNLAVRKGPRWLPAALSAGTHRAEGAQEHIRRILARVDGSSPRRAA